MDSYLVRVWRPAVDRPEDRGELRGTVVHLGTNRTASFQDVPTLVAFLDGVGHPDEGEADGDDGDADAGHGQPVPA